MDERKVSVSAIQKKVSRHLTDCRIVNCYSWQLNVWPAFSHINDWNIKTAQATPDFLRSAELCQDTIALPALRNRIFNIRRNMPVVIATESRDTAMDVRIVEAQSQKHVAINSIRTIGSSFAMH